MVEELCWCMRDKGVPKKQTGEWRVVKDAAGTSEPFAVEFGLRQGSAFSPLLFAIMMDSLIENIGNEVPWQMMFTDHVVL